MRGEKKARAGTGHLAVNGATLAAVRGTCSQSILFARGCALSICSVPAQYLSLTGASGEIYCKASSRKRRNGAGSLRRPPGGQMHLYYLLIFILLVVLASPPLAGAASLAWTRFLSSSTTATAHLRRVQNTLRLSHQAQSEIEAFSSAITYMS
jgi:hypothetical protein